jgi:hypothetical protein
MATLQAINFGIDTGYAASSAGQKPKRAGFASFTPLKSIHHLLHASTDLSSLLLLMCVPGTTRGAGWGCALCFPWYGVPPSQDLFKGRYKNACRQVHQGVLSGFATHSRCCLRSLLEIRVKMYESLKPYARNTTSRIRGCESEGKKQTRWD